jgi:hypothetical protein
MRSRHRGVARRLGTIASAAAWVTAFAGCSDSPDAPPAVDAGISPDEGHVERDAETDAGEDTAIESDAERAPDTAVDHTNDVDAEAPPTTTTTVCGPLLDIMEACVLARDGALVKAPVVGTMTVAAVEQIPAGACQFSGFDLASMPSTDAATRLALEAGDGTRWSVVIRMPGLPATLFQAGETIDLSLDAFVETAFSQTFNQIIAVTRGGKPVFVASTLQRLGTLALPDWTAFGIETVDEGAACRRTTAPVCTFYEHSLRISYGKSKSMQMGQTGALLNLNFAIESASVLLAPMCDVPGFTQIGGFWSPSAP